jgi:hypothetical protein
MQVPQYFILIQYILLWVEYNLKYHNDEITLQPLHKEQDSCVINTSW